MRTTSTPFTEETQTTNTQSQESPKSHKSQFKMQPQTILDAIAELPRIHLARKNTPFEEMPRLRAAIADSMDADISAVPQLFIKREDTTGFAFGGNKVRHMEFYFAHLLESGIDTLVNINHYDSNNARLVAAAAARTGMKCHLVSYDHVDAPVEGNLLIGHLSGAKIHRVEQEASRPLAEELRDAEIADGRNATIVSDIPFFDIAGMIGFLETGAELDQQITSFPSSSRNYGVSPASGGNVRGLPRTPIRGTKGAAGAKRQQGIPSLSMGEGTDFPSPPKRTKNAGEGQGEGESPFKNGSESPIHIWGLCGRSIAGIRLYARNTAKPWTATATAQQTYFPVTYEGIYLDRSARVADLLELDTALEPGDITTLAGYTGTYGYTTEAAIEAIRLVASTEGIILDPNYTGKAMSGLLDQIRQGNVDPETPVIFIHTGGLPQTFAFATQLTNWRPR